MRSFFCLILGTLLFISCDDNINEDEVDNVVQGVWNSYYKDTDSLVLTRVFTTDMYSYFSFAEGKKQNEFNKQRYTINENSLFLDGYTQQFKLVVDTLWITNSSQDQITKYIKQHINPELYIKMTTLDEQSKTNLIGIN